MKKSYKAKEQEPMFVNEPMTEYNVMRIGENLFLSDELLVDTVKHANTVREQGQMIPHGEVYERLAAKLGWK